MSSLVNLRDGFSSGMSFLRRRFSSENLSEDFQDPALDTAGFSFNLPPPPSKKGGAHASAPCSPSKNPQAALQGHPPPPLPPREGSVSPYTTTTAIPGIPGVPGGTSPQKPHYNKDRCKTLLVIDGPTVDWSKYFRGRKILGEWDIRLEQAEFSEVNLASYSLSGVVVDIQVTRNGTKVVRSFKPDFVLIRQLVRDANEDWRNIVIGLHYGDVPCVNSLPSLFSFLDKPWVFSQLIEIERRLGRERFPLVEQSYFPSHRHMSVIPKFPAVVKIGHAHGGMGSVKVNNTYDFEDLVGVVAVTRCYCAVEPFIDSSYDLCIQKIGSNYKAFRRTSIVGNWKVNTGSSTLEQITMTDRFQVWVDECSRLFGGLDIVGVKAAVGKDGQEVILEVSDSSSMPLLGETQEDDRMLIADLIITRMEADCRRSTAQHQTTISKATSADGDLSQLTSINGQSSDTLGRSLCLPAQAASGPVNSRPIAGPPGPSPQKMSYAEYGIPRTKAELQSTEKMDSSKAYHQYHHQQSVKSNIVARKQTTTAGEGASRDSLSLGVNSIGGVREAEDSEDTMRNLRKTFAGIFGDV